MGTVGHPPGTLSSLFGARQMLGIPCVMLRVHLCKPPIAQRTPPQ